MLSKYFFIKGLVAPLPPASELCPVNILNLLLSVLFIWHLMVPFEPAECQPKTSIHVNVLGANQ